MIKIYPYEKLGRHQMGWLDARYHFSFSRYHNPDRMGFGNLRVINDDIVAAKTGFDTHPHEDMEIITYVRKGAITHRDSTGNVGRTEAGDVQVMSAGTGIQHSEKNAEDVDTNLFQIWILPREKGVKPRWDARAFPKEPANDVLPVLVSGYEEDKEALFIHADARMRGGRLTKGQTITQPVDKMGYLLVSEGSIEVDGNAMKRGDGAEIVNSDKIAIKALEDSEVLLLDITP